MPVVLDESEEIGLKSSVQAVIDLQMEEVERYAEE